MFPKFNQSLQALPHYVCALQFYRLLGTGHKHLLGAGAETFLTKMVPDAKTFLTKMVPDAKNFPQKNFGVSFQTLKISGPLLFSS